VLAERWEDAYNNARVPLGPKPNRSITSEEEGCLVKSATFDEWLKETISLCDADVRQERLPRHLRLSLAIAGKSDERVTGGRAVSDHP
jgi:hypothetical protein